MAHAKRTPPEFPIEAYQFAETQHLGTPLNMYRAHTTDGPGCFLAILGSILALIPLAGFLSDDDDYSILK